ncbi:hypothetical protein R1flu_028239 [Riccia fluitans]|uniref:Uncharacterized protein n=1 Tax=Riccia fluitans TaxID=41844 RepID=A0ABD1XL51_9MARC
MFLLLPSFDRQNEVLTVRCVIEARLAPLTASKPLQISTAQNLPFPTPLSNPLVDPVVSISSDNEKLRELHLLGRPVSGISGIDTLIPACAPIHRDYQEKLLVLFLHLDINQGLSVEGVYTTREAEFFLGSAEEFREWRPR